MNKEVTSAARQARRIATHRLIAEHEDEFNRYHGEERVARGLQEDPKTQRSKELEETLEQQRDARHAQEAPSVH